MSILMDESHGNFRKHSKIHHETEQYGYLNCSAIEEIDPGANHNARSVWVPELFCFIMVCFLITRNNDNFNQATHLVLQNFSSKLDIFKCFRMLLCDSSINTLILCCCCCCCVVYRGTWLRTLTDTNFV